MRVAHSGFRSIIIVVHEAAPTPVPRRRRAMMLESLQERGQEAQGVGVGW